MLTKFSYSLQPDRECSPRQEWGYRLYSALLKETPVSFGLEAHSGEITPVSQFLKSEHGCTPIWTVTLLGHNAEESLYDILETIREIRLDKGGITFTVVKNSVSQIPSVEALLDAAAQQSGIHQLRFCTSTAFKSRGQYLNLPTTRLIVQSLIKKWNGCISECPIDDESGEGMETIAAGLRCRSFQIKNQMFYLKGNSIPGFIGEITLENRLSSFHRQLADALLIFSEFAGIGIKTTLGMGGIERQ